jgi:hypothetical protein
MARGVSGARAARLQELRELKGRRLIVWAVLFALFCIPLWPIAIPMLGARWFWSGFREGYGSRSL